ncbi:MetQ/NlpA family ABC transporter substrate-binding protein [Agromyces silvae]|uniref:MetQ/NlpA family ABC transporter substrate-binding protein n=1 Tax=Agromyces silvae TaxID=3388266 RepID=UPI00280BB429|nr:MetQ/NlpA family ABC transporter substrate-binding protein [Agromyces protaetiae]
MPRTRKITTPLLAVAAVAAIALAGCAAQPAGADGADTGDAEARETVTIAIVEGGVPIWDRVEELAAEEGIDLEYTTFTDWVLPNTSVQNDEIDLNVFQHAAFLSQFNVANDGDIVPLGSVRLSLDGLFSSRYDSLDALPDGASVSIPQDAANLGRALRLIESEGLIELGDDAGLFPTPDDIARNPKNLQFTLVAGEQLPFTYPDVDLVAGGTFGLSNADVPVDEALATTDPDAAFNLPYVLVVAAREGRADDPTLQRVAELFQDASLAAYIEEKSQGTNIQAIVPLEELREVLAELEDAARAEG